MSGRLPPSGLVSLTDLHASAADAERRAALHGRPFAVVMVALAGLPLVNARDGFAAGDVLIEEAAAVVVAIAVRYGAAAGRHGPARLALVLPDADETEARSIARELEAALPAAAGAKLSVAVREPAEHAARVLQRARDALRPAASQRPAPDARLHVVTDRETRRR